MYDVRFCLESAEQQNKSQPELQRTRYAYKLFRTLAETAEGCSPLFEIRQRQNSQLHAVAVGCPFLMRKCFDFLDSVGQGTILDVESICENGGAGEVQVWSGCRSGCRVGIGGFRIQFAAEKR
jgi:hypothetical protein